jgi:hypothetical protein
MGSLIEELRRREDAARAEADRLANDSIYGLAGGVVSSDTNRAFGVARRIGTGLVSVQTEVNGTVLPADGDAQGPGWGTYPGPIGSAAPSAGSSRAASADTSGEVTPG